MIDGIKTGCLPLDVSQLADTLDVDISPQTVYTNVRGLRFGFIDRVDTNTGEIRKLCTLHGSLHKYANGGLHTMLILSVCPTCAVYSPNCAHCILSTRTQPGCKVSSSALTSNCRIIRAEY